MRKPIVLAALVRAFKAPEQQVALFALLNLGILDSLANGTISSNDALQMFYHADNCLFVHRSLHN